MSDVTTLRFVAEVPKEHFSKDVVLQVLDQIGQNLEEGKLSLEDFIADVAEEDLELIDIVFGIKDEDGEEVVVGNLTSLEDMSGYDIAIGDWIHHGDGTVRLRIPVPTAKVVRQ